MNQPAMAQGGNRSVFRAVSRFTVVQAGLVIAMAVVLTNTVWTSVDAGRAVRASAWLAVIVQGITFAIAKLVARENMMAGWGLGVVLRFAVLAAWALIGVKALGIPSGPALLSLVAFYFVSTLIEPLFLNG